MAIISPPPSRSKPSASAAARRPPVSLSGAQRVRRAIFLIHLWVGLGLGLFFVVMGLTGSAMAWKDELYMWEARRLTAVQPTGERASLEAVIAGARRAMPHLKKSDLSGVFLDRNPRTPYLFFYGDFANHPNDGHILMMDPYTAEPRRVILMRHTFIGFVQNLHTSLFLGAKGTLLSGWGAVALTALVLSGLWLWWPRTLAQIRSRLAVQRGASFRRRLHDWHNVLGIYLWPLLLLLTVTTVGMALDRQLHIQEMVYRLTGSPTKEPQPPEVQAVGRLLPLLDVVRQAERTAGTARFLFLPSSPEKPAQLFTRIEPFGLFPNAVAHLDPYTGKLLRVDEDRKDHAGGKVMTAIHVLHYGTYGGWATQVLYTVAGILPLGLFITGLLKWVEKRRGKGRNRARREGSELVTGLSSSESRDPAGAVP